METIVGLYCKGNDIIFWCSLCVRLCLSWVATVATCVVIVETCCTKFVQVELTMIMSTKVWKSFLMMAISIHLHVWRGEKWENFLCMWISLFNMIIATVFQSVSWVAMRSLLHKQCSKWILIDGMSTLTLWKMHNSRMWYIEMNTKCYKKMGKGKMKWRGVKMS
jgi:hypothetical protein